MLYYSRKKKYDPWLWWQRTILCVSIAIKSVSFIEWFLQLKPLSLQSHNSFLFFCSYIITDNRWNRYTELFQIRKGLGTDQSEWLCNSVVLVRWSSLKPYAFSKTENSVDLPHHRILATVSKSRSLSLRVSTKTV